jgi:tetratricopeptide (TPR) repeat protein
VRFAGISSPLGLAIALETVAVETQYLSAKDRPQRAAVQRERVAYLQKRFEPAWGDMGAVAEAFGVACRELGDVPEALAWFERAMRAEDGSASQRTAEQAANLRARLAETQFEAAYDKAAATLAKRTPKKAPAATQDPHRDAAVQRAAEVARAELDRALALIEQLIGLQDTIERLCIAGSACKRRAMVELRMRDETAALAAAALMKKHYGRAETLAHDKNMARLYYPALNRMAAELVVDAGRPRWPGFAREQVERVRQSLTAATLHDPDFWSVAGLTELSIYEAVARQALAAQWPDIREAYADLHMRIGSPRDWQSVETTARFVIDRYTPRAGKAERQACGELLALLEGYAQGR